MVSEGYQVVGIGKRDDSFALNLGHREQMLQDVYYSLSQSCGEVVEDQVRVDLRHVRQLLIDVVSQNHILQPEIDSRPDRQVADNHPVRLSSMLVQYDHVG